jgi:vacuolar fusion protein MON1
MVIMKVQRGGFLLRELNTPGGLEMADLDDPATGEVPEETPSAPQEEVLVEADGEEGKEEKEGEGEKGETEPEQPRRQLRRFAHEEPSHARWAAHKKHFFVLSSSGKPIYSR